MSSATTKLARMAKLEARAQIQAKTVSQPAKISANWQSTYYFRGRVLTLHEAPEPVESRGKMRGPAILSSDGGITGSAVSFMSTFDSGTSVSWGQTYMDAISARQVATMVLKPS